MSDMASIVLAAISMGVMKGLTLLAVVIVVLWDTRPSERAEIVRATAELLRWPRRPLW